MRLRQRTLRALPASHSEFSISSRRFSTLPRLRQGTWSRNQTPAALRQAGNGLENPAPAVARKSKLGSMSEMAIFHQLRLTGCPIRNVLSLPEHASDRRVRRIPDPQTAAIHLPTCATFPARWSSSNCRSASIGMRRRSNE